MDDEEEEGFGTIKPLSPFKYRNYEETPCFRRSAMYGILGGFGFGLTHFMFTSNIGKSTKLVLGTGSAFFLGFWLYCRHEEANAKFLYSRLGPELQRLMDERGTDQGSDSDKLMDESDSDKS